MARPILFTDKRGVVHVNARDRFGTPTDNSLCWVLRRLHWVLPVRRPKKAAPTCLWCVALRWRVR